MHEIVLVYHVDFRKTISRQLHMIVMSFAMNSSFQFEYQNLWYLFTQHFQLNTDLTEGLN